MIGHASSKPMKESPSDIAYNSSSDQFLVLWKAEYSANNWNIWARHVTPSGTTGSYIQIATTADIEQDATAAYNPDNDQYLAVWEAVNSFGYSTVTGRRLTGSGTVRSAIFTPIAGVDAGVASITVAAGSYRDAAGNNGGAGVTPVLQFDTLAPSAPPAPRLAPESDSGDPGDGLTNREDPLIVHACHCRDCQRLTGSAFVINLWIEEACVERQGPEPRVFRAEGGSGRPHEVFSCPSCATQLWSRYHGSGATLFVRGGTLDAPDSVTPDIHIFTRSKLPWMTSCSATRALR